MKQGIYSRIKRWKERIEKITMKNKGYGDICKFYITSYSNNQGEYKDIVKNYIQYYHVRANRCKYIYYIFNIIKFLALAIIPVMQLLDTNSSFGWVATGGASVCMLVESILELLRVKDKWILYRNADNVLLHEQREFSMEVGKYEKNNDKFCMFVYSVESVICDEARLWSDTVRAQGNNKEEGLNKG